MSLEVIASVAVGLSLAALIVTGQRAVRTDLDDLAQRVARIEGALLFLTPPRAGAQRPQTD